MLTANWLGSLVLGVGIAIGCSGAHAAEEGQKHNPLADLNWQRGPSSFSLGSRASIKLPTDAAALSGAESDKFLKLTGNLPTPGTSIIAGGDWWATFEFDDSGYVKDDEKVDADELLKQIKSSDGPANEERRKQGLPELYTDGWSVPPHYDAATKQLEWGIRLHGSDNPQPVVNYTVRLLGRSGYERVVLVTSPESLNKDVAEFKALLKAFDFNAGEKYSEFRPGDRVAEFGLAALVAGGAAAVVAKTGFWKVIVGFLAAGWKLIVAAGVAFLAWLGRLFKRNGSTS